MEHIEYVFHAFCKIVLRHEAINAWRDLKRKEEWEISLDYLISEIKLYFTKSHLSDFDSIKIWIESDLKDIIESHVFLSKILLLKGSGRQGCAG